MESARIFWRGLQGRTVLNFNWPIIDEDSTVLVTASEFLPDPAPSEHNARFVGAAPITVRNIRPHGPASDPNHGVSFVIDVDWPDPLDVATDITVLSDKPVEIQGGVIRDEVLAPFGLDRTRVSPRPAVLFILDQAGHPALAHPDAFFESFIFDATSPDAVNYVYDSFGARFSKLIPGPLPHISVSAAELTLAETDIGAYVAIVLEKLVAVTGTAPFRQIDQASDDDQVVSSKEVLFVCIDNGSDDGGMNRFGSYRHPDGLTISADVAFVAHRAGLMTAAHELLHTFGAVDLYGHDGLNWGLTLMGATAGGGPDDRNFALPDPWHRLAMGITRPFAVDVDVKPAGTSDIAAVTMGPGWPALLFWSSKRGGRDCFLVELRTQSLRDGLKTLDRGVPQGFAVWQVSVNGNGVPYNVAAVPPAAGLDKSVNALGKPDLARGSIAMWVDGDVTPGLTWIDGTPAGFRISFTANAGQTMGVVSWQSMP